MRLRLLTTGEPERDDTRVPRAEDQVGAQILLRVPERTVVGGIDGEIAVITPATFDLRLWSDAGPGDLLRLRHLTGGSAGIASRVADGRIVVGTRGAEAESDVAGVIHGDAPHPTPERVRGRVGRCVRPLLEDRRRTTLRQTDLVPANAGRLGRLDRVV